MFTSDFYARRAARAEAFSYVTLWLHEALSR